MNTVARVVGAVSRRWARLLVRWAEMRYGARAVRLCVYSNVLDLSDEPALKGVSGKGRGSRRTQPADVAVADVFWQRCAGVWMLSELVRRRDLLRDHWTPARLEHRPFSKAVGL